MTHCCVIFKLQVIDYICASEVTVEMRSRNSLVALGLFCTLMNCKLEATSVCAVCIRHPVYIRDSSYCNIFYACYKYIHC